jgi:hypothetical protein
MKRLAGFAVAALCWSSASCSDATGAAYGGAELFDPSPPQPPEQAKAGPGIPGAATWSALYADYFGPNGAASCTSRTSCHGSADQAGAIESHYVCGSTQSECYAGITNADAKLLTAGTTFDKTTLYRVLRKVKGGGVMPKAPRYVFVDIDLKRLSDWYAAGAKND